NVLFQQMSGEPHHTEAHEKLQWIAMGKLVSKESQRPGQRPLTRGSGESDVVAHKGHHIVHAPRLAHEPDEAREHVQCVAANVYPDNLVYGAGPAHGKLRLSDGAGLIGQVKSQSHAELVVASGGPKRQLWA